LGKKEVRMVKSIVSQKSSPAKPLSSEELRKIDAYWRATLYLCAGMIFLLDNPLLKEPLKMEHIKKRLLGHWGSDPGQSLMWVHLNRLIKKYDMNMIFRLARRSLKRLPGRGLLRGLSG